MKDDRLYLIHILECIERIEKYIVGGVENFFEDTKTQDAVLRNLHILSESTQHLSEALKASTNQVDWRGISGFRNILVHDYLGVSLTRVWEVVNRDLPDLKKNINALLKKTFDNACAFHWLLPTTRFGDSGETAPAPWRACRTDCCRSFNNSFHNMTPEEAHGNPSIHAKTLAFQLFQLYWRFAGCSSIIKENSPTSRPQRELEQPDHHRFFCHFCQGRLWL